VRDLIRQAREAVARAVNSALVLLNWQVGHCIRTEILRGGGAPDTANPLSARYRAN
jgi:hypothetical protein